MLTSVFTQRAYSTIYQLALTACVLMTSTSCQRDTSPSWLPKSLPTGYLIEPFPTRDTGVPTVAGYRILQKVNLNPSQAGRLANALGSDFSYDKGVYDLCLFSPRLAFSYDSEGKPFHVLVCLKCGDVVADGGFQAPGVLSEMGHFFFKHLTYELFPDADKLEAEAAAGRLKGQYGVINADHRRGGE